MDKILKYIEDKTKGETYKSHRFCFDSEFHLPSLTYEDPTEFNLVKDQSAETDDKLKESKNVRQLAVKLQGKPLFRYFLDGSRRVYKIDDIKFGDRLFPIVGGQIGVACCERQSPSTFSNALMQKHIVIALPSLAGSEGGSHSKLFFNNMVAEINKSSHLERFGIKFSEILTYVSNKNDNGKKEEYMDRGTAQIQDKMIECEQGLVVQLTQKNLLNEDNYLIKDGSLQYQSKSKGFTLENAQTRTNYRRVVGISKAFNPELSKSRNGKSNAANIANLPLYHRTPAAKYQDSRMGNVFFAIWYVRIREKKYTESPFAGILKIEKILVTDYEIENGIESTEVDQITANIINERSPVCYGNDQRWANHLYPVYLTEKYIKSLFLSDSHFLNLF